MKNEERIHKEFKGVCFEKNKKLYCRVEDGSGSPIFILCPSVDENKVQIMNGDTIDIQIVYPPTHFKFLKTSKKTKITILKEIFSKLINFVFIPKQH
jgi:hypothetical protein